MTVEKFSKEIINRTANNIYCQYKLKPKFTMSTSGEFFVKKVTGKDDSFLLKIRLNQAKFFKKRFINEIEINKLLQLKKIKTLILPKKLIYQTSSQPEYLLYTFIAGSPLSNYFFYIGARQENKLLNSYLLTTIVQLQKLPLGKYKQKLTVKKFKENLEIYNQYENVLAKYITSSKRKSIKKILHQNRHLLDQAPLVLTHGDLNPKNIVIKNKKCAVLDWSDVHLNNPLFDLTNFYLFAWNQSQFKQKIKNFIYSQYRNLDNPDRLYLLNRIILLPGVIDTAEQSIIGLKKDRAKKLLDPVNERRLEKKARRMIKQNIKNFLKIVRYLEEWPQAPMITKSIPLFANPDYVDKFLKQQKKQLNLIRPWQQLTVKNLRLSMREGDQKLISQYTLRYPNGSRYQLMAKIRMERGDDLAKQSYQILKILWGWPATKKLISQPLRFYQPHHLYIYKKTLGQSLAEKIESGSLNKKQITSCIKQAAQVLASLHALPTTKFDKISFTNNYNIKQQIKWLDYHLQRQPNFKNKINLVLVKKIKRLSQAKPKKLSFIHGDFQLQNLIIKNSKIKLIDFDNSEINDPAIDVGNFLNQINYKGLLKNQAPFLRRTFLEEYARLTNLPFNAEVWQRLNFNIIMGLVKNINFNFLFHSYDWVKHDLKIIKYLIKNTAASPLDNLAKIRNIK